MSGGAFFFGCLVIACALVAGLGGIADAIVAVAKQLEKR